MRGKHIIFGAERSGKSHKVQRQVIKDLKRGKRVAWFGRHSEAVDLLKDALKQVKGLELENVFACTSEEGEKLPDDPAMLTARLVIIAFGQTQPSAALCEEVQLFLTTFAVTAANEVAFKVYLDNGHFWNSEIISSLPAGSTLVFQSITQLEQRMGAEKADEFVADFSIWEFFRAADAMTALKAAEISGGGIPGDELATLNRGDSVTIDRRIRRTTAPFPLMRAVADAACCLLKIARDKQERSRLKQSLMEFSSRMK